MADRSIAAGDTLNKLRFEFNGTAEDIGDISGITGASGIIASATDVVEAITALNTDLTTISTDNHIFSGGSIIFEGATDDSFETTLAVTDPTADRTITLPNATGTVSLTDATETLTNKTLTSPTITNGVFNTAVSGTAVKDEDDMSSNSATALATQQSIKAYVDDTLAAQDLDIAPDSGTAQSIVLESETLTFSGGTGIASSATSNTLTFAISDVVQLTASQTLTNKTFTSPTIDSMTFASGQLTSGLTIGANGIIIEGSTADAHETTLTAADPTQDNTITIPNDSITCITTATHATKAAHIARAIALGQINIDMADRSVAVTDTLETLRTTYNSTAGDVGDIADLLSATGTIASSTDIVEAVTAMNTEIASLKDGTSVFETKIVFEGATDDAHETTLQVTDPTADRTITLPNLTGTVSLLDATETLTNKTLTAPTLTSAVLNTAVSGSAILDEDDLSSNLSLIHISEPTRRS